MNEMEPKANVSDVKEILEPRGVEKKRAAFIKALQNLNGVMDLLGLEDVGYKKAVRKLLEMHDLK